MGRWDITGKNIMKKIIMFMCMIFGFTLFVNAGTTASCKISGGTDGATVVASIIEVGDGYVMVELDNDGTFAVNVTVTVSYNGVWERSAKVSNHSSTVVKVVVSNAKSGMSFNKFDLAVNGSRCN